MTNEHSPADLLAAIRRASDELAALAAEFEPALQRAAAIGQGQLALPLHADDPVPTLSASGEGQGEVMRERLVRWTQEVLDPLEQALRPAEDAGAGLQPESLAYLQAQDTVQKKIIADMSEELRDLRSRAKRLETLLVQGSPRSGN